ncbi:hypothetical protein ACFL0M_04565 [Thermodesulfobacteriota bacterium]
MYFNNTFTMQSKGAPIARVGLNPIVDKLTAMVVMRHAPHPNAAKLFVRWWMSPDGAAYVDGFRHKGNPEADSGTLTSKRIREKGIPVIYAAPSWVEIDIKTLEKKYRKAVGYTKARDKTKKKKKKK